MCYGCAFQTHRLCAILKKAMVTPHTEEPGGPFFQIESKINGGGRNEGTNFKCVGKQIANKRAIHHSASVCSCHYANWL